MLIQIKQLTTVILIIFGLLIIGFQCKEECNSDNIESVDDPEYDYDFIVDMDVSPLQKVYSIGDTIELSFEISNNTLYDSKSQIDIELGHVKGNQICFDMLLGVPYLDVSTFPFEADPDFFVTTDQPDIIYIDPFSFNEIRANIPCELFSDTFRFDLKLTPLKSGIFCIFKLLPLQPDQLIQLNPAGSCNDNLNNFQTGDISYKFNVADNNPELLEELVIPCDASPMRGLEQKTDEKEFFWIKVE